MRIATCFKLLPMTLAGLCLSACGDDGGDDGGTTTSTTTTTGAVGACPEEHVCFDVTLDPEDQSSSGGRLLVIWSGDDEQDTFPTYVGLNQEVGALANGERIEIPIENIDVPSFADHAGVFVCREGDVFEQCTADSEGFAATGSEIYLVADVDPEIEGYYEDIGPLEEALGDVDLVGAVEREFEDYFIYLPQNLSGEEMDLLFAESSPPGLTPLNEGVHVIETDLPAEDRTLALAVCSDENTGCLD